MSSFLMTKAEFLVLLKLLGIESLPIGITSMPDVSVAEAKKIKDDFCKAGLIKYDLEHLLIDKGLEEYILPLVQAKTMFVYNYGTDNNCLFNTTVYLSGKSAVVLQADNDTVRFIHFVELLDFSYFILKFVEEDEFLNLPSAYMSYISFFEDHITVHVYNTSVSQYRDVFANHLREVWSGVVGS